MLVLPNWRENPYQRAMIEYAAHDVDETDDPDQWREAVFAGGHHPKDWKDRKRDETNKLVGTADY